MFNIPISMIILQILMYNPFMKIEITEANWQQFKSIRLEALKYESVAFSTSFSEGEAYPDGYWKGILADRNNIIILAIVEGKCVGMVRAALKDEDVDENTAFVGSLYVNENYRRMGIGKMLMDELISKIKNQSKVSSVRLWVNQKQSMAIQFYQALGFKKVGEEIRDSAKELIFEKSII